MLIHYCYLLYSYMYRFFLYCSWLHKFHSMEDCNFYSRVIIHTWLYINIYLKKSTYNSVCAHAQNCREKNFFPIFIKSTIFFLFCIFNQLKLLFYNYYLLLLLLFFTLLLSPSSFTIFLHFYYYFYFIIVLNNFIIVFS